jgi:hypothetical protein
LLKVVKFVPLSVHFALAALKRDCAAVAVPAHGAPTSGGRFFALFLFDEKFHIFDFKRWFLFGWFRRS